MKVGTLPYNYSTILKPHSCLSPCCVYQRSWADVYSEILLIGKEIFQRTKTCVSCNGKDVLLWYDVCRCHLLSKVLSVFRSKKHSSD